MSADERQFLLTAAWLFMRHGQRSRALAVCEALSEDDPRDGVVAVATARIVVGTPDPREYGVELDSFDGIELSEDYFDIFESIAETPDAPAVPLIRYMIALIRCSMEEVDGLIRMAVGRYADELEVPMSDKEEYYLEEQEYGQEDE